MDCPRCGQPQVTEPACPRCGVVFAKLAAARPRHAPSAAAPSEKTAKASGMGVALSALGLALALVAGLVGLRPWQKSQARPATRPAHAEAFPENPPPADLEEAPLPVASTPSMTMPMARVESARVGDADRENAEAVARRL